MRGKGEGSIYKDAATGLWTAVVELPARDGKRRRKTIRRKSKRLVLDAMADVRKELKARGDLHTADQTVEQWFQYWLREVVDKEVRPNTADGYRNCVNQYIVPTIGKVKLEKVTTTHIRRVTDAVLAKGRGSTMAMNVHRAMSTSFEQALREGRIGRNPAKLVKAPRKAVVNSDALTAAEGLQVLHAVADDPLGARWAVALLTGARRGEVIGLRRDQVSGVLELSWQLQRMPTGARGTTGEIGKPVVPADFDYRHLIGGLYLTRPKSRAGWRVIPLVDPLKSILERHIANTPDNEWGLVFTHNGRPIDPGQDSKNWRKVLTSTGIDKDVPLHGLRHTAIDLLLEAGVHEDVVMEIVGHSQRVVTRGYKSKANLTRRTLAMEQMSALIMTPDATDTRPAVGA